MGADGMKDAIRSTCVKKEHDMVGGASSLIRTCLCAKKGSKCIEGGAARATSPNGLVNDPIRQLMSVYGGDKLSAGTQLFLGT